MKFVAGIILAVLNVLHCKRQMYLDMIWWVICRTVWRIENSVSSEMVMVPFSYSLN
jgi:hypothetical protein